MTSKPARAMSKTKTELRRRPQVTINDGLRNSLPTSAAEQAILLGSMVLEPESGEQGGANRKQRAGERRPRRS